MQAKQATQLLDEVGSIRRSTRDLLSTWWFPPAIFGLLMLGAAALCAVPGAHALLVSRIYWLGAGSGAIAAIYVRSRRLEARHGVGGNLRGEVLSGVILFAVGLLAIEGVWVWGEERLFGVWDLPNAVGWPLVEFVYFGSWYPPLALALGYGVLGVLERRWGLTVAGLVAALGVAVLGAVAYTLAFRMPEHFAAGITIGVVRTPCLIPLIGYAVAFLAIAAVFRFLLIRPR